MPFVRVGIYHNVCIPNTVLELKVWSTPQALNSQ